MDIQNIKLTKLKKYILITLFVFTLLILIPLFVSSMTSRVNASFKSISGECSYTR